MLELILILPLYVTLLFIVVALSEFGQVSTQAFQVARIAAWSKRKNEEPETFSYAAKTRESFAHFGPRVVVKSGSGRLIVPAAEETTTVPSGDVSTSVLVVAGAHAYPYYKLPNPLYESNGANVDSEYQDDAQGANLVGICKVAMRGSPLSTNRRTEPWLRRHYGSIWVTYKAFGGLFGLQTRFRVLHTVLRTSTWNSQGHGPYVITSHPSNLRDPAAYPYSLILAPDANNHQFEFLGFDTDFEPDSPMNRSTTP